MSTQELDFETRIVLPEGRPGDVFEIHLQGEGRYLLVHQDQPEKFWNKKTWSIVVSMAFAFFLILCLLAGGVQNLRMVFYSALGQEPVIQVENQLGENVGELTVSFSGGTVEWRELAPGERVTQSLMIMGESGLSLTWQDQKGQQLEWDLDCYLESSWYDEIDVVITPGGGIEATSISGQVEAREIAASPLTQATFPRSDPFPSP